MKLVIIVAVFVFLCQISSASRILFLFPSPSKSHLIIVQGLSTTLAEKGHDVTVISSFPLSKPMKNYRDIESPIYAGAVEIMKEMVDNPNQSIVKRMPQVIKMMTDSAKSMMEMPEYKRILREEKFDLVIVGVILNNFLLGVGDHFKCPTIMLSVGGGFTQSNLVVGNPLSIDSVPHLFFGEKVKQLTFLDRFKNLLLYGVDLSFNVIADYIQKQMYK